jgi:hypothetical protein
MKKIITTAFILALQIQVASAEVCQTISYYNPTKGVECAKLISQNNYSRFALSLANKVASINLNNALEILHITANKRLDYSASLVCEKVGEINSSNARDCARVTVDNYFFEPLTQVCSEVASINSRQAVDCMALIANKISINGAEQVCRDAARIHTSRGLTCLKEIIQDIGTTERVLRVDSSRLEEIKISILKARSELRRGLLESSDKSLTKTIENLDRLLNE